MSPLRVTTGLSSCAFGCLSRSYTLGPRHSQGLALSTQQIRGESFQISGLAPHNCSPNVNNLSVQSASVPQGWVHSEVEDQSAEAEAEAR
jgi:hypothetical protein